MNRKFWIYLTLICIAFVVVTLIEFSFWNAERYSVLKSMSDIQVILFTTIGLILTLIAYLYVRSKGWWNVNAKRPEEDKM